MSVPFLNNYDALSSVERAAFMWFCVEHVNEYAPEQGGMNYVPTSECYASRFNDKRDEFNKLTSLATIWDFFNVEPQNRIAKNFYDDLQCEHFDILCEEDDSFEELDLPTWAELER